MPLALVHGRALVATDLYYTEACFVQALTYVDYAQWQRFFAESPSVHLRQPSKFLQLTQPPSRFVSPTPLDPVDLTPSVDEDRPHQHQYLLFLSAICDRQFYRASVRCVTRFHYMS